MRNKKKEIMLCIEVDARKRDTPQVVSAIKNKILQSYYEKAGKFSPPLVFKDLGDFGEFTSSITHEEREKYGFCIISNYGANPEWFEDIVQGALNELEFEEGIGITGKHKVAVFDVCESKKPPAWYREYVEERY